MSIVYPLLFIVYRPISWRVKKLHDGPHLCPGEHLHSPQMPHIKVTKVYFWGGMAERTRLAN